MLHTGQQNQQTREESSKLKPEQVNKCMLHLIWCVQLIL